MTLRHVVSGSYCDRNQRPCPRDEHGKLRCDCGHDDAIMLSLERQDAFYRKNPRSIPGYGASTPQGIEEQYQAAAREKRRIESGVPE